MKKLALIIAVAGIVGLSSCKKCETCTPNNGGSVREYCHEDFTEAQMLAHEAVCLADGGKWK